MKNLITLIITSFLILSSCSQVQHNHIREIANDKTYLQKVDGSEELTPGVKELLDEEQNLHNKALWGANAFSSDIAVEYVPENNPKFPLAYYLIPQDDAKFLQSNSLDKNISLQLQILVDGKKYFKLFVHPESEAHYEFLKANYKYISQAETEFTASPTSSYRSLIVWDHSNLQRKSFIAKVSLDKNVIGSIDRLVSENEVERSIANQNAFDKIGVEKLRAMGAVIYPESAGLILKNGIQGAPVKLGGQLIREIPEEVQKSKKKWLSFSALMSPNKLPKPLIMDVILASEMSSYDFFDKFMIKSYMDMFEELSFKQGINFEPHSQNLGFEVDMKLKPTGKWVIRDFGGVWPDVVTMAKNKGPVEVYMDAGNAAKFKLVGGRSNYISSYVFFYKKQVFDMMINEVAKHDPSLTKDAISKLKEKLDKEYVKMVNLHLGLKLKNVPTMQDYKEIENKVLSETYMDKNVEKKSVEFNDDLKEFIKMKKGRNEIIVFSPSKEVSKYYLTDHGFYELYDNKILSMVFFNKDDLSDYKASSGIFAKLSEAVKPNRGICFTMVKRLFAIPD